MVLRVFASLFALILATANGAKAIEAQFPCGQRDTKSNSQRVGTTPKVALWREANLRNWRAPSCTGWPSQLKAKLLVALSGTFRFDGTIDELLARAGKISQLPQITYWSPEDKEWMPLADKAAALNGPDQKERRGDFLPTEFKAGARLYYWENDRVTGDTVYDLKVQQRTAERAVLGTNNVSSVRKLVFTLFEPGALRSVLQIQRLSPGIYRANILTGAFEGTSSMAAGHEQIYVARARAIYRYLSRNKVHRTNQVISAAGSDFPSADRRKVLLTTTERP